MLAVNCSRSQYVQSNMNWIIPIGAGVTRLAHQLTKRIWPDFHLGKSQCDRDVSSRSRAGAHALGHLSDQYLQWLEDHAYSHHTVYARSLYLREFCAWCESNTITSTEDLNQETLEKYQHSLAGRRSAIGNLLAPQTQSLHLSCLKGFCRWLACSHIVDTDYSERLVLPKTPVHIPRAVLSKQEIERLLAVPDQGTGTGIRNRTMLETLVSTGMRRSELSNLIVNDFNPGAGTVLIREGKGGIDRVVPIGEEALAWVHEYFVGVRPNSVVKPDAGFAFLTRFGRRFVPNGISKMVSSAIRKSGVGKQGSTHLIRHSVATLMLEGGADIRVIQEMLGHKKLTTTQIYTRVSIKTLKRVHQQTHPRG